MIAIEPESQLRITFPSGEVDRSKSYTAVVVYEAPDVDLAVLELDDSRPYLPLASSYRFARGQDVTVVGNPGLDDDTVLENAVSRGILSTTARIDGNEYYQLDISINPGNSGGPVLDDSGHVIGVVTLKAADKEGLGFCIPLAQLTSAIDAAKRLAQQERRKNSSIHNVRAMTRLVSAAGKVYAAAMATYVDAMDESIKSGSDADHGLSTVQPTVDGLVSGYNYVLLGKLEPEVSRLAADPNVPVSIREKFVEAWINYKELKSYVDSPRGDFPTYSAKCQELSDKYIRLTQSLKLLAGVRE